jgi:hypothetical protein
VSGCRSSTTPRIAGPFAPVGMNRRSRQEMISECSPIAFRRSTMPSVKPTSFKEFEPGVAELRLEAEPPRSPFRRCPDEGEHDSADEEHLAPEDLDRRHGDEGSGLSPVQTASSNALGARSGKRWRANRRDAKARFRPEER